jgi:hypothetical protein
MSCRTISLTMTRRELLETMGVGGHQSFLRDVPVDLLTQRQPKPIRRSRA